MPLFIFPFAAGASSSIGSFDHAIHLIVRSENTHESPIVHSGIRHESSPRLRFGSKLGCSTWLWPQPMHFATATLNKAPTKAERDAPLESALILRRAPASTPSHLNCIRWISRVVGKLKLAAIRRVRQGEMEHAVRNQRAHRMRPTQKTLRRQPSAIVRARRP